MSTLDSGKTTGSAAGTGSVPDSDRLIGTTDEAEKSSPIKGALFDLRVIIGGLFVVYGVILTVAGAMDGHKQVAKATGVRINLWTGLAMLAVGLLFLLWSRLGEDGQGPAGAPREAESAYPAEKGAPAAGETPATAGARPVAGETTRD